MNITNQIAFTAKMDVSRVKNNKERWQNIAKIFEEQTQQYPDDVFYVSDNDKGEISFDADTSVRTSGTGLNFEEHIGKITAENKEKLYRRADKTIANKFAKLLRLFRQNDDAKKCTSELFNILTKGKTNDFKEEYSEEFWDKAFGILTPALQDNANTDPVLKMFEID